MQNTTDQIVSITTLYGLNNGQVIGIEEKIEESFISGMMDGIMYVLKNEEFIETPTTLIRCKNIESIQIIRN